MPGAEFRVFTFAFCLACKGCAVLAAKFKSGRILRSARGATEDERATALAAEFLPLGILTVVARAVHIANPVLFFALRPAAQPTAPLPDAGTPVKPDGNTLKSMR